ncbi:hypothetical protein KSC_020850 [Ktedonobacter sp. SOSP1-52]|uniref:tetratricopeptide repeat protein n=1 Tax=Ktedonobacter sp. SOSP1-52 TaxID=2778366 RepID=UPI001A1A8A01|nr:tetratricopeptide repeat protein [Ktedonobacter sp. SOSP1-52]GHO63193.1 hypothetical protein KSC_020850 [Ktedonobacter sp. SOSP1-52]
MSTKYRWAQTEIGWDGTWQVLSSKPPLTDQGRYEEAEPLYQRALAICERSPGAMHPDTCTILNNLAGLYDKQGRHAEASSLYQRAQAISEKT